VALGPGDELARLATDAEGVDERELAVVRARRDGHLQTETSHALGQRVGVVARLRPEGGAAADEDGRLAATVPRAAGALLRVDLGGGPGHHAAGLGGGGSAPSLRELPRHDLVQDRFLRLRQVERDLAAAADDVDRDRHQLTFLLDALTTTTPPFGPGTAPFRSSRLSS